MKLKYYMRGLGIGIILTTLILSIGGTKDKLSDQEIKDRATVLGMEMKDEDNFNLDEVLNQIDLTGTPAPTSISTPVPSSEPTVEPTKEPTAAPTSIPTPVPTLAPTTVPEPTATPETNGQANQIINFTIKSGMSSGQVSKLLVEKGLIKDAEDFNQAIIKEGKASIIRVGDYSLPQGATYGDIIKEITTK